MSLRNPSQTDKRNLTLPKRDLCFENATGQGGSTRAAGSRDCQSRIRFEAPTIVNVEQTRPDTGHGTGSPRPANFQGFQYSSGAFQPPRTTAAAPTVKPVTPPKQPRGRLFVVSMVFAVLAWGGHSAYEAFFHYSAYGVIAGRPIQVPTTVAGVVKFVHVEEGQTVKQGQLLMTLHSTEIDRDLGRLEDSLRMAQAKLQAGISRMKWELSLHDKDAGESEGEFFEKWGQFKQEQARLKGLQQTLQRSEELHAKKMVALHDVQHARNEELGQREKLDKLLLALGAWEKRVEAAQTGAVSRRDELLPLLAEVETLEGEQRRLRAEESRLLIRSPVNGIVVQRHRFTGEGADFLQTTFTILEEHSLHVELFVPQDRLNEFQPGKLIDVQLAPFWERLPCKVVRLGDEHVPPPQQISRFYPHDSKHLPIHLVPTVECLKHERIQIGAIVKLPVTLPNWSRATESPTNTVPEPPLSVTQWSSPTEGFY